MDRETIQAFAKAHHYILPESYINFLLICDNHPEKYCEGYRDIILCSLEELPQERKLYEMDEFCPEYIAIGYGGGGEVLIMKQERDTYTLIVSSGGALLTQFISPEYCTFFNDFFVLLAAPIGWLYDYWAGTGTEQGQWPNEDVRQFQRKADIETFFLSSTPA